MTDANGLAAGVSGYVESLKRDRDRFLALAFCAADLLIEVGPGGDIHFSAGASQSLLGMPPESLIGKPFLSIVSADDRPLAEEVIKTLAPGARIEPVQLRLAGDSGPAAPLTLMGYHLPDQPGQFYLAFRAGMQPAILDEDADIDRDPESGLLQKDAFARLASRQIKQARSRGETLKFTVMKVPELSELRARLGGSEAARAMRTVGACLKANSSMGQAAGHVEEDAYAFLHGQEVDPDVVAHRVASVFKAADPEGKGALIDSGSLDADLDDATEADAIKVMLYTVRKFCEEGSGVFKTGGLRQQMKTLARETSERLAWFRGVTRDSRFDIAFQPIVSLRTGAIHHFEALARFDGKIEDSPYDAIAFAENAGVITDFDLAMASRVLEWLSENDPTRKAVVAVNVSGRSVANAAFVGALHGLLNNFGGVRSRVVFEVTESARIEDLRQANEVLQGLRAAGHKVCLDDFGAGSAALRYLHALDVDTVKIDGQYVRGAQSNPRNRKFLKAVAGLCRDLGIATIAEMVEDKATARMLAESNVDFGQGYMFGRPSFDMGVFQGDDDLAAAEAPPLRRMPNAWA